MITISEFTAALNFPLTGGIDPNKRIHSDVKLGIQFVYFRVQISDAFAN